MSRAREIADLVGGPTPDIILKTADGAILNLQTSDTTVTDGSVLGAINFTAPNEGSGTDAITVGAAIQAVAEGTFAADNNATELVFMTGASEAATSKMVLSSAGNLTITGGFNASDGSTITTDDNSDNLTLTSTDTDAAFGPNLAFYRNSANPADNDLLAQIKFTGRNDNAQDVLYADLQSQIIDASDGTEDGRFQINTMVAGTNRNRFLLMPTETVFNDNAIDLDFRVESDGNTHMLFVDGGNDRLQIGSAATDDDQMFQLIKAGGSAGFGIHSNRAAAGGSALILSHNRNASVGSFTILQDNDALGRITFQGCDGADIKTEGAQISAEVDGTPGTNDMPTRLVFYTTADGASSITERLRITASGRAVSQFTAQAWANINQVGTIAINDSFNISGVTDRSAGKSTFTFAVNMANDDFATSLCSDNNGFQGIESQSVSNVLNANLNSSGTFEDRNNSCLIVFGDSS